MKPPSNDADRPNAAAQAPGAAKDRAPDQAVVQPQAAKPGSSPSPQARPSEPLPPGIHVKSEQGKPEQSKPVSGTAPSSVPVTKHEVGRTDPPITAGPKGEPDRAIQPSAGASDSVSTGVRPGGGPGAASADPTAKPATDASKPGGETAQPSATSKPGPSGGLGVAATIKEPGKPVFDRAKTGATGAPQTSSGDATQGGSRPAGALTDGPIIDLKAKRVEDAGKDGAKKDEPRGDAKPATAASAGLAAGMAAADRKSSAADGKSTSGDKTVGTGSTPPRIGPAEAPPARGPGFGSVAAAGLLGGVIGAGLLFAVERAGVLGQGGDEARLNALDQRIASQFTGLDQRMANLSPRDAVAALDKRVAANEAVLKPLPDAVKAADAAAKQALDRASAASPAALPTAADGQAPAATAPVPADIAARLDSLDQRVSALQEEPGREQPGDARVGVAQAGEAGKQLTSLDGRVKALEDKTTPRAPTTDLAPKLAILQGEVEARTKANAEADQALGQRLDALQKTLDDRVKAATEAVQTATQASRDAADAGRTTAEAATKAVDRRLQEQADRIAALDKAVALRAEVSTVQAALKVVTADRIAAALDAGVPYAEPLATLRKLETGDTSRIDALAPFAEKGAPTADQLATEFRPIADKAAMDRKTSAAKDVAANGDLKSRFLSIADSIVQVRKVDAPAATAAADSDPVAKVQAALDRGALIEAARAYEALPQDLKAQAGGFGATLASRASAAKAAQALLSDAFKGLPTTASSANP